VTKFSKIIFKALIIRCINFKTLQKVFQKENSLHACGALCFLELCHYGHKHASYFVILAVIRSAVEISFFANFQSLCRDVAV
jgi:hypothetical protein